MEISDDSDPPTEQRRRNGSEMHELWRNGSAGLKKESARFFSFLPWQRCWNAIRKKSRKEENVAYVPTTEAYTSQQR